MILFDSNEIDVIKVFHRMNPDAQEWCTDKCSCKIISDHTNWYYNTPIVYCTNMSRLIPQYAFPFIYVNVHNKNDKYNTILKNINELKHFIIILNDDDTNFAHCTGYIIKNIKLHPNTTIVRFITTLIKCILKYNRLITPQDIKKVMNNQQITQPQPLTKILMTCDLSDFTYNSLNTTKPKTDCEVCN